MNTPEGAAEREILDDAICWIAGIDEIVTGEIAKIGLEQGVFEPRNVYLKREQKDE